MPVAIVGTCTQDRYGNVQRADALLLGVLSLAGAVAGVALANALSGALLRDAFAALHGARRPAARAPDDAPSGEQRARREAPRGQGML